MAEYVNFGFEVEADGVATATWDMPDRRMNVLSASSLKELGEIAERVSKDEGIKALVLASGKDSFCAGADLDEVEGEGGLGGAGSKARTREERVESMYAGTMRLNDALRELETCGKPVAAAMSGTALGGGYEVALACHRRVAARRGLYGLPEASVGLMPGGGGTQRLPRLLGAKKALPLILMGKTMDADAALSGGLVDEAVEPGEELERAKRWVRAAGEEDAKQPWDRKKYRIPGGGPYDSESMNGFFVAASSMAHAKAGDNYPQQRYMISSVYEGLQVPIEGGLRIEARYFVKTLLDPRSRAMVRSLFVSPQALRRGARRPEAPKGKVGKLGVLGGGLMGGGIAYVSARAGIEVVLLDKTQEDAQRGALYGKGRLEKEVERGKLSEGEMGEILGRIKPTTLYGDLKGCDFVVEAVYEDREVKGAVTRAAEAELGEGVVFGTNTSTLPITGLAEASARGGMFLGTHFFSPVERMSLVELIRGEETTDAALARAMDYVKQIGKTPIVVKDSRGFYTSRVFGTYVSEGLAMLEEGVPPAMIENVGRSTGMPMAPLELSDAVGIALAYRIRKQTREDMGEEYEARPGEGVISAMVEEHGREGRATGKGFYDYGERGKRLWRGLSGFAKDGVRASEGVDVEEMRRRFLYVQALEAARCFEEGVVSDVRDADVGAIFGWGFAPWSGGPLSLMDMEGLGVFVERCDELAEKYGERFRPNELLREMGGKGEKFYGRFAPGKAA